MNGTADHIQTAGLHSGFAEEGVSTVGTVVEGIGAIGAGVVAIIGLAGILSSELASIGIIALGASLLFEGGIASARVARLLNASEGATAVPDFGGVTAEFMGGGAGIILGVLSLIHIVPFTLMPVAVIVFGAAMILGSRGTLRFNMGFRTGGAAGFASQVASMASGADILTGLAAVILGILALTGGNALTLTLIAVLAVSAALAMSGTAIGGRVVRMIT